MGWDGGLGEGEAVLDREVTSLLRALSDRSTGSIALLDRIKTLTHTYMSIFQHMHDRNNIKGHQTHTSYITENSVQ